MGVSFSPAGAGLGFASCADAAMEQEDSSNAAQATAAAIQILRFPELI
jgi:hypothetical protein